MSKNRQSIFAKGLGKLEVREVEPTSAADFSNAGYIKSTVITDDFGMADVQDETGNVVQSLPQTRRASAECQLMQSSADEATLLSGASSKKHAIRYSGVTSNGRFQYFMFPLVQITPGFTLGYQVGERLLPLRAVANIDASLGYDVPPYVMVETNGEIRTEGLQLFVDAKYDLNAATVNLLDLSGYGRHGVIAPSGDAVTIWGQADILRLDGSNDVVSFGDVCDFDADDDFMIEAWVRVMGANGSLQEILAKKAAGGTGAGYAVTRTAANTVVLEMADGTDHPTVTSYSTLLTNTWTHVAVVVDRDSDANTFVYLNGSAGPFGTDVSAVGDMTNTESLEIGKLSTGYGQVDVGAVRIYNFGASGLPSDIAAIALRHYNAEKSKYGL